MASTLKYAANEALKIIDGPLADELGIHRFNEKTRSKAQLFAVKGMLGRQFGIVLGNTDVTTGHHPAQQTRILLERCQVAHSTPFGHPFQHDSATCSTSIRPGQSERSDARFSG